MITLETLGGQIAGSLSNVRPIVPTVIRGEKSDKYGNPYAVYFFALSSDLKEWAENLEERQDEIIGPSYFQSPGDLRWNHYLYVLASEDARSHDSFNDLKQAIEGNRSYARKFVLAENELPLVLKQLQPSKTEQREISGPDVVGRWTNRLSKAGLSIVLDQRPIAETVRQISIGEKVSTSKVSGLEASPRQRQPIASSFLSALELVHFRKWPTKPDLSSLGTVNLIVGANGAGKTTLLEAIEYFYCQENARTPAPHGAHIKARLQGMTNWLETRSTAKSAEAKQRNLDWYGQRDLRGSTLQNSFARFNFLSTDEAAILGQKDAKVSFDEMLSRLVSGPKAAELSDHLSRLAQPLSAERSRLHGLIEETKQTKTTLETLIKTAAASPRASDSDLSSLGEDLSRLGWRTPALRDTVGLELVPSLNRASSIARELMASGLGTDSVSNDSVVKARHTADLTSQIAERILKQIAIIDSNIARDVAARQPIQQKIQQIESIKSAQQLNAFSLFEDHNRLQQEITLARTQIGGEKLPSEVPGWLQSIDVPLTEAMRLNVKQVTELAAEVTSLENQVEMLKKMQSRAASMLAEIRALAKQLLVHTPEHTNCPVCATNFQIGELKQRLEHAELEATTDHTGPTLKALLSAREQKNLLEEKRNVLSGLITYARRCDQNKAEYLPQKVLLDYCTQRSNLERLEDQQADLSQRLTQLSISGLNIQTIRTLQESVARIGIDLQLEGSVDATLALVTVELKTLDANIEQSKLEHDARQKELSLAVCGKAEPLESLDKIVGDFRNLISRMKKAESLFGELKQFIDLESDLDIASIVPLLDSAKVSAEHFTKALESEKTSQASESAAREKLSLVEERIKQSEATLLRIKHAIDILNAIENEDSLLAATETELLEVQEVTDSVFRRIHSPHEYGVRRDMQAPLYRLDNTNEAITLRDISTGQRAAFVLSVFLAMNSKLQTAPPVLLFDDPVAHIDDFNALSFLDHLRDIAVEGKRQIFYATADTRIAGLFEHKFSFLGDGFKRIELTR